MRVQIAHPDDIPPWLTLAAEVEPLFGPMVGDPAFHAALRKNIDRGTAFCVRVEDGPPGASLMGGMLFSPYPPQYEIGWLWPTSGGGAASGHCWLSTPSPSCVPRRTSRW
jgi:hypothetical protein